MQDLVVNVLLSGPRRFGQTERVVSPLYGFQVPGSFQAALHAFSLNAYRIC